MQEAIEEYNLEDEKACKIYEERKGVPGFMLPSIPDMMTRCKTIFQKADQACQYFMSVIRLFYPEITEKEYYTNFEDFVKAKSGEDDPFSKFLHQVVPFVMEIRRARNCFDHRKVELRLTGFELQDDGSVCVTYQVRQPGERRVSELGQRSSSAWFRGSPRQHGHDLVLHHPQVGVAAELLIDRPGKPGHNPDDREPRSTSAAVSHFTGGCSPPRRASSVTAALSVTLKATG